ncbi:hypothetical protein [Enterobacter kobei]|uniref:hypothetical protein n=1 Tax=Enterobacter kobei TaxID=208224 RepID=UPI0023794DA3|nr:hypothetical protein [Enterobacter kobei]MDD9221540.1 hypothetical protein [Enterobacter kobei]
MHKTICSVFFLIIMNGAFARELLPEEVTAVESTVKQGLKDPYSAHFELGDFPETDKNSLYCGLVNAKNSYGAYTGNQLFSVMLMKNDKGEYKALSMDKNYADDKPLDQEVIAASCASAGYPVKVKKYLVKNVNKSRKAKGLPNLSPAQIIPN